jgi:hypothetical protein
MKKLFLLLLMGLIALVPMASASVRTDGMGIQPVQDADLDTIWTFPQDIEDYALVDFRFDAEGNMDWDEGNEWGGIIADMPKIGKLGIYLRRPFNSGTLWGGRDYINAQYGSILTGSISWGNLLNVSMSADNVSLPGRQVGRQGTNFSMPNWPGPYDYINQPENKIDLFKSFAAGDGILGLRLNFASNKSDNQFPNEDQSYTEVDADGYDGTVYTSRASEGGSSVIGIDLGYGMKDLGPFNDFDVSAGYSMGSYRHSQTVEMVRHYDTTPSPAEAEPQLDVDGDGISEIRFALRGKNELTEDVALVTNVGVKLGKLAVKRTSRLDFDDNGDFTSVAGESYDRTREYKNTGIVLTTNTVHSVNEGSGKVICGLNFISNKGEWTHTTLYNDAGSAAINQVDDESGESLEISYMGAWINIAVEASLKSWLLVRGGMSKDVLGMTKMKVTSYTNTNTAGTAYDVEMIAEDKWNDLNDVLFTFGVGVEHKNWVIDLVFDQSTVENTLKNTNYGEGLLYDGDVVGNAAKLQVKYLI